MSYVTELYLASDSWVMHAQVRRHCMVNAYEDKNTSKLVCRSFCNMLLSPLFSFTESVITSIISLLFVWQQVYGEKAT